jgi:hypothetical protein
MILVAGCSPVPRGRTHPLQAGMTSVTGSAFTPVRTSEERPTPGFSQVGPAAEQLNCGTEWRRPSSARRPLRCSRQIECPSSQTNSTKCVLRAPPHKTKTKNTTHAKPKAGTKPHKHAPCRPRCAQRPPGCMRGQQRGPVAGWGSRAESSQSHGPP